MTLKNGTIGSGRKSCFEGNLSFLCDVWRRNGRGGTGAVVNIVSVADKRSFRLHGLRPVKAAVISITESLAAE